MKNKLVKRILAAGLAAMLTVATAVGCTSNGDAGSEDGI